MFGLVAQPTTRPAKRVETTVNKQRVGRNINDVRYPELIWRIRYELAVNDVRSRIKAFAQSGLLGR